MGSVIPEAILLPACCGGSVRRGPDLAIGRKMVYSCNMNRPLRAVQPDPAAVLGKAVLSAASRLELRGRHLGDVLGTSEASISRLRARPSVNPGSKQGELALLFLRLYR